jgi:hypothetical protein
MQLSLERQWFLVVRSPFLRFSLPGRVIHLHIPEQEAKYSGHLDLFSHPRQNSRPTFRVQAVSLTSRLSKPYAILAVNSHVAVHVARNVEEEETV